MLHASHTLHTLQQQCMLLAMLAFPHLAGIVAPISRSLHDGFPLSCAHFMPYGMLHGYHPTITAVQVQQGEQKKVRWDACQN
jgi:hypothetical protein